MSESFGFIERRPVRNSRRRVRFSPEPRRRREAVEDAKTKAALCGAASRLDFGSVSECRTSANPPGQAGRWKPSAPPAGCKLWRDGYDRAIHVGNAAREHFRRRDRAEIVHLRPIGRVVNNDRPERRVSAIARQSRWDVVGLC